MRILHLLNRVQNSGNGIANVAMDLAIEQKRLGHVVTVASSGGDYVKLLEINGIEHRPVEFRDRNPRSIVRSYRRLRTLVRELHPDIVHAHTLTPTVLARLGVVGSRARVVATVHNEYQRGVWLMGTAHAVVGVSEAVNQAMGRRRIPAGKRHAILNGVHGSTRKAPLRDEERVQVPPKSIVFIGAVSRRKGVDVLVQAFDAVVHQIPEAHLFIVGNIHWRDPVEWSMAKPWAAQVHFVGFDPVPERYLVDATVFALASRREPLGLVLLEAMGQGVPVVASDVDGIPEVLNHGEAGLLFPAEDAGELAARLISVLGSAKLRQELADRGRQHAMRFTVEAMATRYIGLYRDLVNP